MSITSRIKTIFAAFSFISLVGTYFVFFHEARLPFVWVYQVLLPLSVISTGYMAWKPRIGNGSLFLLPLLLICLTRLGDLWWGYFMGDDHLGDVAGFSAAWSFLLISIALVDLLESRIYHRMVTYIEQEAER